MTGITGMVGSHLPDYYRNREFVWDYGEHDELDGRNPYSAFKISAEAGRWYKQMQRRASPIEVSQARLRAYIADAVRLGGR